MPDKRIKNWPQTNNTGMQRTCDRESAKEAKQKKEEKKKKKRSNAQILEKCLYAYR